jgi:hypothetical protein
MTEDLITVKITTIYSKDGIVLFDAEGYRVNVNYTNCIVPSRFRYEAYTPEQGDKVLIQKTDQGEYVLHSVLSVKVNSLPTLEEGEYILKFDENTKVHITPDGSGNYNIDVEAGGDISVSAQGDVTIDEGGTPKKVAYQNHTHDYSGSTSDGASYSGTTTQPNEDGTQTEVE